MSGETHSVTIPLEAWVRDWQPPLEDDDVAREVLRTTIRVNGCPVYLEAVQKTDQAEPIGPPCFSELPDGDGWRRHTIVVAGAAYQLFATATRL